MTRTFNAASRLRLHASERPDAPCLRMPSAQYRTGSPSWDTITFRELDRLSDDYARGFAARGARAGDRVLMLFRPSVDFFAVSFAVFKLGAAPVLLDPAMGLSRLRTCIEQANARVLVGLPIVQVLRAVSRRAFAAVELAITAGAGRLWPAALQHVRLEDCRVSSTEPFRLAELPEDAMASLLFTSGSTGTPKGVIATQTMFDAQLNSLRDMLELRPGLIDMQAFAPFAMLDICAGMCAVIPNIDVSKPAAAAPEEIVAAIQANRPELAFGSPVIWHNVVRHCEQHNVQLPSLKTVMTVGAPIPAYLHRRLQRFLPEDCQILTPYGATEAMPVSNIGSAEILRDTWQHTSTGSGTCVGRPAPGIDLRVIPITEAAIEHWSDDLALAAGEIGEIVVGGAPVSPAYQNSPAANRLSKIRDGERILHRMGDLGYLDAQQRLWFCGRKAHRLQTAQGVVSPDPVEGVFNEHPDVFRTALVGVGEPGRQIPVLCVEMDPGRRFSSRTIADLRRLAEPTRFAGLVQHFLHHPGFPTDARHNSKIRREELREWATRLLGRELAPASAAAS